MKIRAFIPVFFLLVIFTAAQVSIPAAAQTPAPPQPAAQPSDDQVNAVARELYCPVCQNTPLDVCPTKSCANWRELIRTKLSQGWDKERIKQYFADQYGDRVLPVPPARGLNWLVYALPPLILLGGALLVFYTLRRMRPNPLPTASPPAPNDDEYLARVEDELKKKA